MTTPKPKAPKSRIGSKEAVEKLRQKRSDDLKPRLTTYLVRLLGDDPAAEPREVRAEDELEAGAFAFAKWKAHAYEIKKKPFEAKPHLTQRLVGHEGLKALRNQLTNASKGGK